jgi:hypothetical protein
MPSLWSLRIKKTNGAKHTSPRPVAEPVRRYFLMFGLPSYSLAGNGKQSAVP